MHFDRAIIVFFHLSRHTNRSQEAAIQIEHKDSNQCPGSITLQWLSQYVSLSTAVSIMQTPNESNLSYMPEASCKAMKAKADINFKGQFTQI